MIWSMHVLLLVFSCSSALMAPDNSSSADRVSHERMHNEWKAWMKEHGKLYTAEKEEYLRRGRWFDNWEYINKHNRNADIHGFTLKMNQFGDLVGEVATNVCTQWTEYVHQWSFWLKKIWVMTCTFTQLFIYTCFCSIQSFSEYSDIYSCHQIADLQNSSQVATEGHTYTPPSGVELPSSRDWRNMKVVTRVKSQVTKTLIACKGMCEFRCQPLESDKSKWKAWLVYSLFRGSTDAILAMHLLLLEPWRVITP